jgi:CopG family transcriptional regulator/antitoxin EndoAI
LWRKPKTLKFFRKGIYPQQNENDWGRSDLSQLKKVLITVPDSLLQAVDKAAKGDKVNRSEFVREAMKLYLHEKKRRTNSEKMKKGYQEMAELNLNLAETFFAAEEEAFSSYEEKLAECE